MKKNLIKIVATATILSLGLGFGLSINKTPINNEAAQYIDNFDDYIYSGDYYSSITSTNSEGLNGDLRKDLTSLIYPKDWYTYGSAGENHLSTQLQYADEDPSNKNNMIYFYSRDSVTKNAANSWNREHVWPQSLSNDNFGTGDGAGSDVLHIRPTYNSTNGQRGSLLMADVNKDGPVKYNGMLYGYISNSKFEPLDSVKGDVARIYMYVWTAYHTKYSSKPLNILSVIESYDTLLKWHTLDKPDQLEGKRNDYAEQSIQKNRNPFVDHPEYAWKIFGNLASSEVKASCQEAYPADGVSPISGKTMTGISISGQALKNTYYVGESFDPTGLTVTANYDDESSKNIPVANCTWTPNPLSENTTEVSCYYNGFSAKYAGITVIKRETPGGIYGVEFIGSADSGTDVTANTISQQWKNNTLVKSAKDLTKVYPGAKGLKLGSSKADGSITFVFNSDATNNIIRIEITTTVFSGSATFTAKLGNETIGSGIDVGSTFEKTLNKISAQTLTISSSGRMYLNSIYLEIEETKPVTSSSSAPSSTPLISSEPPISSMESNSSTNESSSIETSSSMQPVSSIEQSSSVEPSSSIVSSSSEQPSSYAFLDSSSTPQQPSSIPESVMESVESSITSSEATNPSTIEQSSNNDDIAPNPDKKKGCNGSFITSASLLSVSALIGLVFVLSKKK